MNDRESHTYPDIYRVPAARTRTIIQPNFNSAIPRFTDADRPVVTRFVDMTPQRSQSEPPPRISSCLSRASAISDSSASCSPAASISSRTLDASR